LPGRRIIDCCSLLNLYAGWGDLHALRDTGDTWYVGEAVVGEAQFVSDVAADGSRVRVLLDLQSYVDQSVLQSIRPETEVEIADYVEFALDLDDGEAQALALAKNRGLVLLTDERKALRIARRPDVAVPTITTAKLLTEWAGLTPENLARLPDVLQAIEVRARFFPRSNTPDGEWWAKHRAERKST
jgi:predicted nucleic acid-binding protein